MPLQANAAGRDRRVPHDRGRAGECDKPLHDFLLFFVAVASFGYLSQPRGGATLSGRDVGLCMGWGAWSIEAHTFFWGGGLTGSPNASLLLSCFLLPMYFVYN